MEAFGWSCCVRLYFYIMQLCYSFWALFPEMDFSRTHLGRLFWRSVRLRCLMSRHPHKLIKISQPFEAIHFLSNRDYCGRKSNLKYPLLVAGRMDFVSLHIVELHACLDHVHWTFYLACLAWWAKYNGLVLTKPTLFWFSSFSVLLLRQRPGTFHVCSITVIQFSVLAVLHLQGACHKNHVGIT